MSIPEASSQLFTEPSRTGTPWKQEKRAFAINLDYLEELLLDVAPEDSYTGSSVGASRQNSCRNLPRVFPKSGPSKLILHSSSTNSIFHATNFKDLGRAGQELKDLFGQNPEDAWWLDMQNPSEREVRQLCAAFNVHPLTMEDILARETSEKIEEYPSYRFACFQSFHEVKTETETEYRPYTVYMVVFSEGTLSFCFDESEHSSHVEVRITKFEDHVSIKSDWVFYAFVDDIVDSFTPVVTRIEKEVDQIDDQVYTTRKDDMKTFLWRIEAVRREVLSLIRLLSGKTKVLRVFENHHCLNTASDSEIRVYINDVQDHVSTMLSSLYQFEGLLSRSKSSYLAQLEIQNVWDRHRVFRFLSRASIFSMILTACLVVNSLFAMNTSADNWLFMGSGQAPWYIVVGGELLFAMLLFYAAKKWKFWW